MAPGPNEKSDLLPNNKIHKPSDDQADSPFNPKSMEQKIFAVFLIVMVIALLALGAVVIYDSTAGAFETREIESYDETANSQLDLLNSMYDEVTEMESGCETTLLLLRHCDKDNDWPGHHGRKNYCSWVGRERSYHFASLFDPKNPQQRWPRPAKIFALTEERDTRLDDDDDVDSKSHYREIETVMPLAHMFNMEIDVYDIDDKELARDYFELLQGGSMCGKATVVSWKHELIPDLALALACGPDDGCPIEYPDDSFDEVWQIRYVYDPEGKAKSSPETDPMNLPVKTQRPLVLYNNDTAAANADDYADDDADDDHSGRRKLRKSKAPKKHRKKWFVYGFKTFQYFDALQFSMKVGDYPADGSGSPTGGKWADEM